MLLYHLLLLALIQGITEFLPVSSSAHLVFMPKAIGFADQGLALDVATHLGTLGAVLIYFRGDIKRLTIGGVKILKGDITSEGWRLFYLLVATLPVIALGFIVHACNPNFLRSIPLMGVTSILFGSLLYYADHFFPQTQGVKHLTLRKVFAVGVAQALALIPGTSRSGACMTALRFWGLSRPEAARFSCLMSIPTILGAGTLITYKLYKSGDKILLDQMLIGGALSFVVSLSAIALMMKWLERCSFTPFVFYRVILGVVLLVWSCC